MGRIFNVPAISIQPFRLLLLRWHCNDALGKKIPEGYLPREEEKQIKRWSELAKFLIFTPKLTSSPTCGASLTRRKRRKVVDTSYDV